MNNFKIHLKICLLLPIAILFFHPTLAQINLPTHGICAHRGAMNTHPENTIAAFEEAIRLKAQMIEFDVRMTSDKQLVILHDETVDRTTNGTGKIESFTLEEVRKLDAGSWKSADFINEKIPTFAEALAVMPDNIWLNVHLKGGRNLGKKVAEVLVRENKLNQAFVACGAKAAKGVRKISLDIKICNMERQGNTQDYVIQTVNNENEFIQLYNVPVTKEIMSYTKSLKSSNVKINYCCTDSSDDISKLFEYGIDFVLVNELDQTMKTIESKGTLK